MFKTSKIRTYLSHIFDWICEDLILQLYNGRSFSQWAQYMNDFFFVNIGI